jgi:anti-anti-sigma factor
MRIFEIDQDMDHAGMSKMKDSFDDLARSPEDVCLDLSQVRFLDSAGIKGMVSVRQALRNRWLKFGIVHAKGQPQHLLHQVRLDSFVGSQVGSLS